jgi:ribosome biogenesis GTPase
MIKNTIFRLTLKRGIVVKTTGSWHTVLTDQKSVKCRLKGNFRMRGIKNTNPVAVGDEVDVEMTGPDTATIVHIRERRNYIIRKATNLSRETHILAANVDQLVLLITLDFPETPLEFVDRFLLSAEAYHIQVILAINKTDLYNAGKIAWCGEVRKIYEFAGYPVLEMSVETGSGIEDLASLLTGKFSVIAGNSGVGKSSLINLLCPGENLKTAPISSYHLSGKHTTTYPEMFALPGGGHIIDTPGIRGFGIIDISRNETGLYFTDIFRLSKNCQFYNCQHLQEPGCAVTEACRNGILHESRYRSYVKIITGGEDKYRLS